MPRRAAAGLLALLAVLASACGDDGRAKTRPADLFKTPPAGLEYKLPDKASLSRVAATVARRDDLRGHDTAVRTVARKGVDTPGGYVIVVDAHSPDAADEVARGFAKEAQAQSGVTPVTVRVAGNEVSLVDYKNHKLGGTTANGYAIAAVAGDEAGVRLLLARLIFAAREAQR